MVSHPYEAPRSDLSGNPEPGAGKPGLALGLGIFGLIAWFIPIVGLPVTISGIILGVKALSGPKKGLAVAAVILCGIGLFLAAINMAMGAYLGATGQHDLINQLKNGPAPR